MGANEVIAIAKAQVGKPYVWAAAGPNAFDCSGLVVYAFKHGAGMNLPHYTGSLIKLGSPVSRDKLAPGDLIFPNLGHVQIYIGNGQVVEAPQPGTNVRITKIWGFGAGARRLIAPGTASGGSTGDNSGGSSGGGTAVTPASISGSLQNLDRLGKLFTDPQMWKRVSFIAFGAILLIVGTILLTQGSVDVKTVAKLAKKVSK